MKKNICAPRVNHFLARVGSSAPSTPPPRLPRGSVALAAARMRRALARLAGPAARVALPAPLPSRRPVLLAATRLESSNAERARVLAEDLHEAARGALAPASDAPRAPSGSRAAEARILGGAGNRGSAARDPSSSPRRANSDADAPSEADARASSAAATSSSSSASSAALTPPAPSVVYVDTLEMLHALERAGFTSAQAEAVTRLVVETTKKSADPLASKLDLERHATATEHAASRATAEMHSRLRELDAASKHNADALLAECEKLRAELRYAHEKVSTSQKLDLNLERGRIRDELQSGESKTAQMEIRLDREISSMKTTIEAAKSDVIKYSLGAVMSMAAVGMSMMRLLM